MAPPVLGLSSAGSWMSSFPCQGTAADRGWGCGVCHAVPGADALWWSTHRSGAHCGTDSLVAGTKGNVSFFQPALLTWVPSPQVCPSFFYLSLSTITF